MMRRLTAIGAMAMASASLALTAATGSEPGTRRRVFRRKQQRDVLSEQRRRDREHMVELVRGAGTNNIRTLSRYVRQGVWAPPQPTRAEQARHDWYHRPKAAHS